MIALTCNACLYSPQQLVCQTDGRIRDTKLGKYIFSIFFHLFVNINKIKLLCNILNYFQVISYNLKIDEKCMQKSTCLHTLIRHITDENCRMDININK